MGTDGNTLATADTKITVVIYDLSGAVIAHFCRAHHDAAVAIDALVL
jgi:hypothetical protein